MFNSMTMEIFYIDVQILMNEVNSLIIKEFFIRLELFCKGNINIF
jgi:hypothetical protein